ncbi:Pseudopilin GspJ [Planctomycetes bacterium MalM25]|nr:Pseudopilin GspJ [Planctomycetes bacterium MalM25]
MSRRGFSLLELVLAISLSVTLVALLGFAFQVHLSRLDSSRSTIEQAQVARAVLDRIASDLRATTMAPTQDLSEAMASAEAAGQFNVDEVDQTQEDADAGEDLASETDAPPGVNGLLDRLTIDHRLMRQTLTTTAENPTPAARADAGWVQVEYRLSADPNAPGLIRTESARDAVVWRIEQGQPAALSAPFASEVQAVAFRYFDGDQWLEMWDMGEEETLPLAVEVKVILSPADDPENLDAPAERRRPRTYRRVVRLAAAEDEAPSDAASSNAAGAAEASDLGGG